MKLKTAWLCLDCEEIFDSIRNQCPICNSYGVRLSKWVKTMKSHDRQNIPCPDDEVMGWNRT
jgi:hypothetical protein